MTFVQGSHFKLEDEKGPCVETEEEQEIEIIKVTHAKNSIPKRIRKRLDKEEENLILRDQIVTDLSINVAQNMLHEQYRLCGGLQDTGTLLGSLQFVRDSSLISYTMATTTGSVYLMYVK